MIPAPWTDTQIVVSTGAPNALTCTIGAGGKGGSASPFYTPAYNGYDSSITCPGNPLAPHASGPFGAQGGGAGASDGPSPTTNGHPGGSGGGATNPGNAGGSSASIPTGGYGNDGGAASGTSPHWCGGGGGGIGGSGIAGTDEQAGPGGVGLQLPTVLRDPKSAYGVPGPSGTHWIGGGGGGGYYRDPPSSPFIGGYGGGSGPLDPWGGNGPHSGGGDASTGEHYTGGRGCQALVAAVAVECVTIPVAH